MLSSPTLALASSIVDAVGLDLAVSLVSLWGYILINLRSCLSFVIIVFTILVAFATKTSRTLSRLGFIFIVLILIGLLSILDLRNWTFAAFTAEIVLTSSIIHFVVVHHINCSVALSWSRFLIFTTASLWVGTLLFFNYELLTWVCINLLDQHVWLLLLTNLSHVLLLSFVLFESFFRLISCQLGVRCPFWQICGLTGCLDLLFTNILLLCFHLGRVLGATPVDIVFVLTTSHHDHAGLVWNWSTWCLAACGRIILLSIVSRELVFILQEWVLTYVVLLGLLRKLLTDRSHHAGIFAGRCVNFINFFFSLVKSCTARLVWLDCVVRILVWNAVFWTSELKFCLLSVYYWPWLLLFLLLRIASNFNNG